MSAAADARGLKRACTECGIRFYDMNKRPIICPNCGTEFTGVEKPKGRKPAAAPAPEKKEEIAAAEETAPDSDEVSLEDAAAAEDSDDNVDGDDDLDLEGDLADLDDIDGDDLDDDDMEDLAISKKGSDDD